MDWISFQWRVTLGTGERVYTKTRKTARWVMRLWGGRAVRERVARRKRASKLYFLKCWGPDPAMSWKDRTILHRKLWVSESLARLFAWKWELKGRRYIADFVRGDVYLDSGKCLKIPHSSERVPF